MMSELPSNKAYQLVAYEWCPGRSVITVGTQSFGGQDIQVIAGPCSVETPEQIHGVAQDLASTGAKFLRGGVFKPRTSPHSFQGVGTEGLPLLLAAGRSSGLPVVTELMDVRLLGTYIDAGVDIIQVGARNMQNFDLLRELGRTKKSILLKRGMAATIREWLLAAEHIAVGGNTNIILCERGIRTFETAYRNVLDISAIPFLKKETYLPVIVDPSHAAGKAWMVPSLASAAIAAGADGLLIEVHPNPSEAWSDGEQALNLPEFAALMQRLRLLATAVGRTL